MKPGCPFGCCCLMVMDLNSCVLVFLISLQSTSIDLIPWVSFKFYNIFIFINHKNNIYYIFHKL